MSIKSKIMLAIKKVARDHDRTLAPLTDDLVLLKSGLDSLSLAVLIVHLEDELNVDPFSASMGDDFPMTLRDFFAAYERAVTEMALHLA